MVIPDAALFLAGFVLAHSAWSVSDLPAGELLTPLAIIESSGERRLLRFEADTQNEAVARGKAHVSSLGATVDAWAFAREGLMPYGGSKVDVLSVDFWVKGMDKSITLVQRFVPYAREGCFRLIGEPMLIVDGVSQPTAATRLELRSVLQGVQRHEKVAALWSSWKDEP